MVMAVRMIVRVAYSKISLGGSCSLSDDALETKSVLKIDCRRYISTTSPRNDRTGDGYDRSTLTDIRVAGKNITAMKLVIFMALES